MIHVFVPLALIAWVWAGKDASQMDWIIRVAVSGLFIIFVYLTGLWGYATYYLRYFLIAAFPIAVFNSYFSAKQLPLAVEKSPLGWFVTFLTLAIALLVGYYIVTAIRGYRYPE